MITLTKLLGPANDSSYCHVWPLRVEATSSDPDLSAKIFLYARNNLGKQHDIYLAVADMIEMKEIPEDKPGPDSILFRTDNVEIACRSQDLRTTLCSQFDDLIERFNNEWSAYRQCAPEIYQAEGDYAE